MNRCGLDADQALTFLANTATLSELAMDDAARRLLATTTPEPPPTALLRRVAPKELVPDNAQSAYPFHPPKGTS
jgi:hypothetical protein